MRTGRVAGESHAEGVAHCGRGRVARESHAEGVARGSCGRGRLAREGGAEDVAFHGQGSPYEDGGGRCSPGHWPRASRRLPDGVNRPVIPKARRILEGCCGGEEGLLKLMLALAAGRQEASPFGERAVTRMRTWLEERLEVPEGQRGAAEGQALHLGLTSSLLKSLGDPDWRFVKDLGSGVPIGDGSGNA